MNRLILILTLCFAPFWGKAQPVFQMSDYASVGDTFVVSSTQLNLGGLAFDSAGANINWDFSTLVGTSQETVRFIDPDNAGYQTSWIANCILNTGGVFTCPGQWNDLTNLATLDNDGSSGLFSLLPVGVSNIVTHYDNDNNFLRETLLGVSVGSGGLSLPFPLDYDIPDTIYRFPLNYTDADSSDKAFTLDLNGFGVDFLYQLSQKRVNEVEGWGSVITPYDTFPSALKLRTVIYHNDSITTGGNTLPGNITTEVVYTWLDPGTGYPVLQASGLIAAGVEAITSVRFIDSVRCFDPTAFFVVTPIPVIADPSGMATVNFANFSQNADVFTWNFGDGNSSTDKNPSHNYSGAGVYQAQLIACNSVCNPLRCDTTTIPVIVLDTAGVAASFIYNPGAPCVGDTISFNNFSFNADQYFWDFGDGNTSTQEDPDHAYAMGGSYNVMLVATGGTQSDTVIRTVSVGEPPIADAGNDTTISVGQSIQLAATGGGNNAIYAWSFDLSLSCLLCATPNASPSQTTTYILNVQNNCGTSSDSITVTVDSTGLSIDRSGFIANSFMVFPNPVRNELFIRQTEKAAVVHGFSWRLFHLEGKLVSEGESSLTTAEISLDSCPQGMYLLQITADGKSGVFRIIKE